MFTILHALGMSVVDLWRSWGRLEAENLFLRHQLGVTLWRARLVCEYARARNPIGVNQIRYLQR